jgi:hypothetical protein
MVGFALRVLSRPNSGSLRWAENLTKNLAACHRPSIDPVRHKGYLSGKSACSEPPRRLAVILTGLRATLPQSGKGRFADDSG